MNAPRAGQSAGGGGAFAHFSRGFMLPLRGIGLLLSTPGVKRYAVAPLLANALVYALVIVLAVWGLSHVAVEVDWQFWGPTGQWLSAAVKFTFGTLKWIVGIPLMLILCYLTFTTVGMIVASPFNDLLSEKLEKSLCRRDAEAALGTAGNLKSMGLSLIDSARIAGRQILCMLLVLPLLVVPLLGALPLLLVNAHFSGLGFVDVAMARNHLRHRHKQPILRQRRWEIFGMGLCMELLFMVPLLGLVLLPLGVTGGTLLYCSFDWDRALTEAGLEKPEGFVVPEKR